MQEIVAVDPSRCRIWEHHSRLEEYLTAESCQAEIASFESHGQLVPVLARRLPAGEAHSFEVISGARRWFVAQQLQVPIKLLIKKLTDRQAAIALEIENAQRKDLSAYERGRGLARWLSEGYFASQEELARVIGIDPSQVCRLLKVARLPNVLMGAFASPDAIRESWGLELASAWENERIRPMLAAKARRLAKKQPRLKAESTYQQLMATLGPTTLRHKSDRDEVVLDASGEHLYRIRHQQKSIALVITHGRLGAEGLEKIKHMLSGLLQTATSQVIDLNKHLGRRAPARERTPGAAPRAP